MIEDAVPPGPVNQTEERRRLVEDIVSDETLPVAERQLRLEALAAQWGLPSEISSDDETDPFRLQVSRALAMLAEGGHN